MMRSLRTASLALVFLVTGASAAVAQYALVDVLARHGIEAKPGRVDAVFDAHLAPTVAVSAGSFATPLAILTTAVGPDRIDAAYAFGILAGRSGRSASPQELSAAGQALVLMMNSGDRRTRIAGARVAGRVFAAPTDRSGTRPAPPSGTTDALFALLNEEGEPEQLAAMDAFGLLRETSAVTSLTERYRHYRDRNQRALAGGALEALARIGDPSSVALVRELAGDRWAQGRDATALAVVFAREKLLQDGSIALIQQALGDKSRRGQARGYLAELGAPVP
jgi:hypothetical protein